MAQVSFTRDGELRWGDDGAIHSFTDDASMAVAFRKAVAEGVSRGDVVEGVEEREVALKMGTRLGFGVEKDLSDSRMVAWYPTGDLLDKLAGAYTGAGATPREQLHLTLLYLGDPDEDGSGPWDDDLIAAALKLWAHRSYYGEGIDAQVTGFGRFVAAEDQDVIVALIDSPAIADLKRCVQDCITYEGAIPGNAAAVWGPQHGFIPHITLGYVPKGQAVTVALDPDEFKIDTISYCVGGQCVTFPITGAGMGGGEMAVDAVAYKDRDGNLLRTSKAGRILSGKNLQAAKDAITTLQAMVDAEESRGTMSLSDEDGDEATKALSYLVQKAVDAEQYTFGPLYAPERKDAHGEWTDAETLQKAVWDYVRSWDENGRGINLQHDDSGDAVVGEALEICSWPYETTIKVAVPGGVEKEVTLPAGTVYMGVHWNDAAWEGIQKGKLTGLSLGGRALRVQTPGTDLEHMGYKHAAAKPKGDYGDVKYADPGYQEDKKPRYPLDSEQHVRAAWSYIHQEKNAALYTAEQLKAIEARITAAGKEYEIDFATEKGGKPNPGTKRDRRLRENADKATDLHSYKGEDDGVCEVCNKSFDSGMHIGSKNDPEGSDGGDGTAKAIELTVRTAKAEGALAERRATDALLGEALKALGTQPQMGDIHMHLPAHDLTIHTPDVHNDITVEKGETVVNVPDTIKTIPAATRTRPVRGADGLIEESITEPVED